MPMASAEVSAVGTFKRKPSNPINPTLTITDNNSGVITSNPAANERNTKDATTNTTDAICMTLRILSFTITSVIAALCATLPPTPTLMFDGKVFFTNSWTLAQSFCISKVLSLWLNTTILARR